MGRIGRWIGICLVVLSACTSGDGPNETGPTTTGVATATGAPSDLDGAYVKNAEQLVIDRGRYDAVISAGVTMTGSVTVDGPSVTFAGGPGCTQPGIYTWTDEGPLLLIPGNDPCEVRATALGGSWVPVPPVNDAQSGELALLSDGTSIARYQATARATAGSPVPVEAFSTPAGFAFSPTVIRGAPGEEVQLDLRNDDRQRHSFVLDSQGIDVDLPVVDSSQHLVTVTIPESGALTFSCRYHRYQFMLGELQAA